MLKRLIFVVLVLGLITTLCGTAISDEGLKEGLQPVGFGEPSGDVPYILPQDGRPAQPTFKKPESALISVEVPEGIPPVPDKSGYFCDADWYYDDTATSIWVYTIPDDYGDDFFNMRFTVTKDTYGLFDTECTLKTAYILMYGPYMTGAPDMKIILWDDDGFGFPNNVLEEVVVPNAYLPAGGFGWVGVNWTLSHTFTEGDEYHIGWTTVDNSGAGTDVLACVSDKATGPHAGEERSSESWNGIWGTMLNDWGDDVSFFIESGFCSSELPPSDCFTRPGHYGTPAYIWDIPGSPTTHNGWGEYFTRFSVESEETLSSVDLVILGGGNSPNFGDDDVIVKIYANDNGGWPGTLLGSVTAPAGTYDPYPAWTNFDFHSLGLAFTDDFFVGFTTNGTVDVSWEVLLTDPGTAGTFNNGFYDTYGLVGGTPDWWFWGEIGWPDYNFFVDVNMCKDAFTRCKWDREYTGLDYYWDLPDAYGTTEHAQKFFVEGDEARIEKVRWRCYDDGTNPSLYTNPVTIKVYQDNGGVPGQILGTLTKNPPFATNRVITANFASQNIFVMGYYWVSIEAAGAYGTGIQTGTDFGGGEMVYGAAEYFNGAWGLLTDNWAGVPDDINFRVQVYQCVIPWDEVYCEDGLPDGGWFTPGHDYARTGHSFNTLGTAQCDLTLDWNYQDADNAFETTPIVYDNRVIQAFEDKYRIFRLDTGVERAYSPISDPSWGDIHSTPTLARIDVASTMTWVLFTAGGVSGTVDAWNAGTGAHIWNWAGGYGETKYTTFTLLNDGVMDVVYFGTEDGSVVALEAATGALYAGWSVNPINLGASAGKTGTTDGANLYFGTYPGGTTDGDIFSVDGATGALNWTVVTTNGGLAANAAWPPANVYFPQAGEGFLGGLAYENGFLYANSRIATPRATTSFHQFGDGVFYKINTGDGSFEYYTPSTATAYGTPVIDANKVYVPGYSMWDVPMLGAQLLAFHKETGSLLWGLNEEHMNGYWNDIALSCERFNEADLIFAGGADGFLSCVDANYGTEIFRRRIDGTDRTLNGIAIDEGVLVVSSNDGGLMCLKTDGIDRPRLEIQSYRPEAQVELGTATNLDVDLGELLVNTGCVDLTINDIVLDDVCPQSYIPSFVSIRPEAEDFAGDIADMLTSGFVAKAPLKASLPGVDDIVRTNRESVSMNAGSKAAPAFINSLTAPALPYTLSAGDGVNIVVNVDQSQIVRGPQYFCMIIDSDDPDFWLNDVAKALDNPGILVKIVGGCLVASTELDFGMGAANTQDVYNTGRIANAGVVGFDIDGDNTSVFQGTYIMGVSQYRIAMNCRAWHGTNDAYTSMVPDNNYMNNDCVPYLETGVTLGEYYDGGSYSPVLGNMVYKTFIDSVQNFDDGGGWDWTWTDAPYDNALTMGLVVNSRTAGAVDYAPLKDLTVEIFEVSLRDAGASLANWKFGATVDYDAGGDIMDIDRTISTGWTTNGDNTVAWGMMKLPFGCASTHATADFEPMINVKSLWGRTAHLEDMYYDSAYTYLSGATGVLDPHGEGIDDDREAHYTIAANDFGAGDMYTFAVANFRLGELTDATDAGEYADFAHLVNKWVGGERGDVNNDGMLTLADIMYLVNYVHFTGQGPQPFKHLGDVNADDAINHADILYMCDFYFEDGDCPAFDWVF